MKCVAYMRVSTEKQAEEGNGLDSQKRDIQKYAGINGLLISDWYIDDGYTGANMNRPALQRLIADCMAKKIDVIICFKLDRLSRGMVDGLYIIEKIFLPNNVSFKCVHDAVNYDDPMQQAYTQMMAVFAQLDKNTMALRMRGGMLERVKKGYWTGGGNTPYCYKYSKDTGTLIPIEDRAETARLALDMFLEGKSDKRIQLDLGYKNEMTVRSILTSPVNIGMIPYKGEVYQGLHEPIFDKDKFNKGLEMRKIRRKHKSYCLNKINMLTGLCYCGVCGCSMRYQKWASGPHKIYCNSRVKSANYLPNYDRNCNNTLEWARDIEKQVEEEIIKISLDLKNNTYQRESKIPMLEKKLETLKTKIKRLYDIYSDGDETVVELITEKRAEIKSVEKLLEEEIYIESNQQENFTKIKEIKKIADIWDKADNQQKNKILKSIVDKIIVVNGDVKIILNIF